MSKFKNGDEVQLNYPDSTPISALVNGMKGKVVLEKDADGLVAVMWDPPTNPNIGFNRNASSYVTNEDENHLTWVAIPASTDDELTITADETTVAAIEATARAANSAWYKAAGKVLAEVARKRKYFTTDEVWKALPEDVATPEPRAMGALMQQAAKQGTIYATKRTKKSKRKECHQRPVRVWQSRTYQKFGR